MSRDTSEAVPDHSVVPVDPFVLDSLLSEPHPRAEAGAGLGVWLVDTDALSDDDLEVGRGWLDAVEQAQASSRVRAELRRAYEVAHASARLVLGAATGTSPEKVVWGRHPCPGCGEPHGRPRAEGAAVEFSLSHTPGQVLVAVADVPVGVDVERHPEDPTGLAKLLHPRETEEIEAAAQGTLDGGRASVRFTRAWSRTEAYLKGIGIGLGRDPHLDYLGTDAAPGRTLGEWRLRDVVVPEGYGAAIAVRA
ncbi:4'-phosphopantetheinyl transferase superfamily protein [Nocardioides sp. zg-536]|uniref:4'-phosphopantetheinyl transferase superfamily protein n=1 Tax=Nocardioides faecalis TaxID=2803858 RepID=A0A939BWC1_9ACTN|nr:4'-phosphopantetheinyl transferase superfamily protein [Nocardioides faecalis]MBM9460871.1 4'-phosphopantetheinyl transferase superfamily protein [Nocardioides faecalis]QVI59300.1 4'-phosphopantetheinyl transferase superfamily protein [Nocardioides faecalis]